MSAPILSLPVEVMRYIFTHFTVNELDHSIGQVCKDWLILSRDVFIRTRLMWTYKTPRSTMRTLLERCPHLLQLEVYETGAYLLRQAADYCPKLRKLVIDLPYFGSTMHDLIIGCPDLIYLEIERICNCVFCIEICLHITGFKKLQYLKLGTYEIQTQNLAVSIIEYIETILRKDSSSIKYYLDYMRYRVWRCKSGRLSTNPCIYLMEKVNELTKRLVPLS